MLIYDHIIQDHEATEENAINHANGLDWQEIEVSERSKPLHSTYHSTVNGIDIYYCYGSNAYFFVKNED